MNNGNYGARIGWLGSGSGDANYFVVQTRGNTEDWTSALQIGNSSKNPTFFADTLTLDTTKSNAGIYLYRHSADTNISWKINNNGGVLEFTHKKGSETNFTNAMNIKEAGIEFNHLVGKIYAQKYCFGNDTTTALGSIALQANGELMFYAETSDSSCVVLENNTDVAFRPSNQKSNAIDLGLSSNKWRNVYASTYHGNLDGKLVNARNIKLAGNFLTGSASFDGSADVSITAEPIIPVSGKHWRGLCTVQADGVTELGKYLDFHNTAASTKDFDVRLTSSGANENVVNLPTITGTLTLTTDKSILNIQGMSSSNFSSKQSSLPNGSLVAVW